MPCYRVSINRDGSSVSPIIEAIDPADALDKARVLGPSLMGKRLPWLMEDGRSKPPPRGREIPLRYGTPVLIHRDNRHADLA